MPAFANHLKIRNLDLGKGILLAPMAGITDSPVRRLAARYGADLVCSEMVAAKALYMVKRKTALARQLAYVRHHAEEKPFCVQLFGHEPEVFGKAAAMVLAEGADMIDINAGCPVRKVVGSGSGAALMRDPERIGQIVQAVRAQGDFPLSIKIRLGWDDAERNFLEVADVAQQAGVDAITLHARTRSQMFGGRADWEAIAQLVRSVPVPVIGNGDVRTGADALRMFDATGCAGIMVGRGASGRPWVFSQIRAALEGKKEPADPTPMEIFGLFADHFHMLAELNGEERALRGIRKHLLGYTKGMPGAVTMRRTLYSLKNPADVLARAEAFFRSAQQENDGHAQAC